MPVQWSVEKVKDYEDKFPDRFDAEGERHWNDVTMSIMWSMLALAQWNITEKNWEDMFRLIHLYERLFGAFQQRYVEKTDGGHQRVDKYITAQEVYDHIGFSVNGGNQTVSVAKNRMVKNFFEQDCTDLIRGVKKEDADSVV